METKSLSQRPEPGLLVKIERIRRGWTQRRLAESLPFGRERLSQIERSLVTDLKTSEMVAIQKVLGVPFEAWAQDGKEEI